ncbi:hypothetical protein K501DRAFT_277256 [Backusella circina FSU 941]|nr:hypothetical protein K501DRAFT_277256 [Backusella circina FSU 941]
MTKEQVRKRGIHPIYDAVCDKMLSENHIFQKALEEAISNNTELLEKVRQMGDLGQPGISIRETLKVRREISGGPDDIKVHISIHRPVGSENEVLPIMIFSHGGGFAVGSHETHITSVTDVGFIISRYKQILNNAHMMVVFVEYSLSPEVKFPVAPEEIFATLCWIRENAASINGDPEKIVVLGDSAGGNLSATVSLMAKDRGMEDAIKAQVLFYPCLSETTDFPSYEQYGDGYYLLAQKTMQLFYDLYLTKRGEPHVYATPIVACREELIGLPPALVITAECDILRDEGEAYTKKMMDAGVDAVGIRVLGTIHGFMTVPFPTPQYITTFKTTVDFIKKHLDF